MDKTLAVLPLDNNYHRSYNDDEQNLTKVEIQEKSPEETQPKLTYEIDKNEKVNHIKFQRVVKTRKKGATKGQTDIYVITPDGKTLRSTPELISYCTENNLIFNESLNVFSKTSSVTDDFTLPKSLQIKAEIHDEALCTEVIPRNRKEALQSREKEHWKHAMNNEIDNMIKREVWTPVPKTSEITKVLGTRWVYTLKSKDKEKKFKARLVALGNHQREGQDFNETYSPVVNFTLIRLFIAFFICTLNWKHSLLDVKCAYLYGKLDTPIFIAQPIDYVIPGKENYVLRLNKALYGLHQAGKCWFEELHNKLIMNEFKQLPGTQCVYTYKNRAIILVYVDDLPVFAKDQTTLQEVIKLLESLYEVENLGPITKLLGIDFLINQYGVLISCDKYIVDCMKHFDLYDTNTLLPLQPGSISSLQEMTKSTEQKEAMDKVPFRNLLGCLHYIAGRCRPDISFAVASLSQMVESPAPIHWQRLTQVMRYLNSTRHFGLWMPRLTSTLQIATYCDSSWASDPITRRSWTGYSTFLNKAPILWRTVKQTCIAISPMESEYIAASEAAKDTKYITNIVRCISNSLNLREHAILQKSLLFCDNTAAIQFCKNEAENIKNRHIDIKYKFVKELHENGWFEIKYVNTKHNVADILTKALPREVFNQFRSAYLSNQSELNLCNIQSSLYQPYVSSTNKSLCASDVQSITLPETSPSK